MKAQASNILPLNEIIPLAQSLARKEAHRPDDVDDLVQIGLFAYHKAELRHKKLRLTVDKPMSLARTTLQRAIRGYYWQQREWQERGELNKATGLDAAEFECMVLRHSHLSVGLDGRPDDCAAPELLEFDDYFNALERKCGRVAREVVENLLMPSGECAGKILLEVWTKQAGQKEFSGKSRRAKRGQPRGVKKEIRISHRLVRDAMQISPTEWVRTMERIREFTRNWIGR